MELVFFSGFVFLSCVKDGMGKRVPAVYVISIVMKENHVEHPESRYSVSVGLKVMLAINRLDLAKTTFNPDANIHVVAKPVSRKRRGHENITV